MNTLAASATETEVREFIQARDRAIGSRDLDALMNFYAEDVLYFDCIPPFQARGQASLRSGWEQCYPHMPERFGIVSEQLQVYVHDDVAAAHWFWRFVNLPEGHGAGQTIIRSTAILERRDGQWKIVHEHGSVPFDPYTSNAVFAQEP